MAFCAARFVHRHTGHFLTRALAHQPPLGPNPILMKSGRQVTRTRDLRKTGPNSGTQFAFTAMLGPKRSTFVDTGHLAFSKAFSRPAVERRVRGERSCLFLTMTT